jgi:hypothetical protein
MSFSLYFKIKKNKFISRYINIIFNCGLKISIIYFYFLNFKKITYKKTYKIRMIFNI